MAEKNAQQGLSEIEKRPERGQYRSGLHLYGEESYLREYTNAITKRDLHREVNLWQAEGKGEVIVVEGRCDKNTLRRSWTRSSWRLGVFNDKEKSRPFCESFAAKAGHHLTPTARDS